MSSEWLAPPDFQAIARHSRSRYRTAFSAATVPSSLPRSDATSHALTAALASPPGLLLLLSLGLWLPPPLRAPPGIPRGRARDAHAPCDAAPSGRDRAGSRAEVVARGAPPGRALPASPRGRSRDTHALWDAAPSESHRARSRAEVAPFPAERSRHLPRHACALGRREVTERPGVTAGGSGGARPGSLPTPHCYCYSCCESASLPAALLPAAPRGVEKEARAWPSKELPS